MVGGADSFTCVRCAPGDKPHMSFVRNPLTGTRLRVGGGMFERLLLSGQFNFRVDANGNLDIVFRVPEDTRNGVSRVFLDPSPSPRRPSGALRRDGVDIGFNRRQIGALNEFIAGARYDEIRDQLVLNGFEDGWLELEIGGLRIRRDPNDMDGPALEVAPINANEIARRVVGQPGRQGRVDAPVHLPFVNVLTNGWNAETQGYRFCGERALGVPVQDHTIDGLFDAATEHGIGLRMWSMTGELMRCIDGNPTVSVLAHDKHFYLVPDGRKPKLPSGPVKDVGMDMTSILNKHRVCYYERNGMAYINDPDDPSDNGVYPRTEVSPSLLEEWMSPFFRYLYGLGPGGRMCRSTFSVIRKSNFAMMKGAPIQDWRSTDYITIDMNKCYYTAFCLLVDMNHVTVEMHMPFPNVFSEWRPYEDDHMRQACEWYAVKNDFTDIGGLPQIIPYVTLKLLESHGIKCDIYAYISFDTSCRGWRNSKFIKFLDEEMAGDLERQSKFSVVCGMWGSCSDTDDIQFELGMNDGLDDTEVQEYLDHDFIVQNVPDEPNHVVVRRFGTKPRMINRYHLNFGVKQMANYLVMRTVLKIKDAFGGALPVKVTTDGLMYRRADIRTVPLPFRELRSAEELLAPFLSDKVFDVELCTWKFEENLRPTRRQNVNYPDIDVLNPPESMRKLYHDQIITKLGPPGVGKTYWARQQDYDYAVAYTNDRATANDGITVHRLFGGGFSRQPDWDALRPKLYRKCIWFDEIQMATMEMWSWLAHAVEEFETRLILTGDADQLCAIDQDNGLSSSVVSWDENSAFLGDVEVMQEHELSRNSPDLVLFRDSILLGRFAWELTPVDAPYTTWNIAFHNDVCDWVSDRVAEMLGQTYGGDGLYVGHNPRAGHPLITKATIYLRTGDTMTPVRMSDQQPSGAPAFYLTAHDLVNKYTKWDRKQRDRSPLKWAYCQTGYKCIGKTFGTDIDFTVWESDQEVSTKKFREYMYTAVTRACSLTQVQFRASPLLRRSIR